MSCTTGRLHSFLAATAAGFASSVGQVLILRELLVLFHGNELSTGLVFTGWLLWTALGSWIAGRLGMRAAPSSGALGACLTVMALALPATILWIRASRFIWSIPVGELIPAHLMLSVTLCGTSLFCIASGGLFALAWSAHSPPNGVESGAGQAPPLAIYLGEALGAAAGGLTFYFLLLPRIPALAASCVISGVLTVAALVMIGPCKRPARVKPIWLTLCLLASCAGALAFIFIQTLDTASRKWQWGAQPLAVLDTPFHNLALLENADQLTFFANGLWLFSAPDRQSAEHAVHLALLQHPHPKSVLLLGGGVAGMVEETLKYSTIEDIDYVELDPQTIVMAQTWLPASQTEPLSDPRSHIHYMDAGSFVRAPPETAQKLKATGSGAYPALPRTYDVILLNTGDPLNAEANRFYTRELFLRLARLLSRGGILSFAVSSAPDVIGPAQARYLKSVAVTLKSVFPAVLVFPGDSARFFAAHTPEALISEPAELVKRIGERKLELQYVREYHLFDDLSPLRQAYIQAVLSQGPQPAPNTDFKPTCYFNGLMVWGAQLHHSVERMLLKASETGAVRFWIVLWTLALVLPGSFWIGRPRPGGAIALNVALVGGAQMALQIVLLLAFQILEGFVYEQMALIVSFFMAGAALGAGFVAWRSDRIRDPRRGLIVVQTMITVHIACVMLILFVLHHVLDQTSIKLPIPLFFSLLAVSSGLLGGAHFSVAARTATRLHARQRSAAAPSGPTLYAVDLAGAAAGAVLTSLVLFPVYGLATTLLTCILLTATGTAALGKRENGETVNR